MPPCSLPPSLPLPHACSLSLSLSLSFSLSLSLSLYCSLCALSLSLSGSFSFLQCNIAAPEVGAADVYCLLESCLMGASKTSKLSNHSTSLKFFDCAPIQLFTQRCLSESCALTPQSAGVTPCDIACRSHQWSNHVTEFVKTIPVIDASDNTDLLANLAKASRILMFTN